MNQMDKKYRGIVNNRSPESSRWKTTANRFSRFFPLRTPEGPDFSGRGKSKLI